MLSQLSECLCLRTEHDSLKKKGCSRKLELLPGASVPSAAGPAGAGASRLLFRSVLAPCCGLPLGLGLSPTAPLEDVRGAVLASGTWKVAFGGTAAALRPATSVQQLRSPLLRNASQSCSAVMRH